MRKVYISFFLLLFLLLVAVPAMAASTASRVKDIAKVQGIRANQLQGYGLVVGLNGTGDSNKSIETMQSVVNMLKGYGVTVSIAQMQSKNVAAVIVTAQLPPFAKPGDTIDTTVSSLGDAKSIQGGTLLQTPLKAATGAVYAVAQGTVTTGGSLAGGGGSSQQKGFPTVGIMTNGAIVERDVPMVFASNGTLALALSQPDFTTASRISQAIDSRFGSISQARDPGTVVVIIPPEYRGNAVSFVAAIEELPVLTDTIAKVVINERTGTIVMGSNVTVDEVAIAQGGLTVRITKTKEVSQPPPLSGGSTKTVTNTNVDVSEDKANVILLPAGASVGDVVNAMNATGATPRDIINILQAMKAAGALHADVQII